MYEQEMTIRNWAFKVCLMPKYLNILKQSRRKEQLYNVATLRTCMLTCASTIARAISARKTHRMEMV